MRITKRAIDAAAPGSRRVFLWDSQLKGFGVAINPPSSRHPAGSKVYVCRYVTREGRDRRMALGAHGELTPDQARDLAAGTLARVRAGEDPLSTRREARQAPTLAEVFSDYLEERKSRWKPTTRREVERVYEIEVKGSALGSRKVGSIRKADVVRLHGDYLRRGKPTLGNRVLAWLSGAFEYAERTGLRPEGSNPCRRIERHAERRRERHFSADEIKAIGGALATRPPREAAAVDALTLLALTGLRRNEVLGLRWAEVDFDRRLLTLEETKSGRRLKALGADALALLKRRHERARKGAQWVFPSKRGQGPLRDIRKTIVEVYKVAKITDASSHHVWRHTFTTTAAEMGVSELIIAAMVGHRLSSVTSRYSHLSIDGAVRQADERVQARIAAALQGKKAAGRVVPLRRKR